jgi:hypothetical protein
MRTFAHQKHPNKNTLTKTPMAFLQMLIDDGWDHHHSEFEKKKKLNLDHNSDDGSWLKGL